MARLAAAVQACLPDWQIRSATLAAPEALERALDGFGVPLIFPFFMADGWFTQVALPRRLQAAGQAGLRILPAFGLMQTVWDLAAQAARIATLGRGWQVEDVRLVLAAHGSGRSSAPAAAAGKIADHIRAQMPFAEVRLGFIEEEPGLEQVAAEAGEKALCLPLFVARWGHVAGDIPAALAAAKFRGPCLAALGTRPEVPEIIAAALRG